MFCFFWSSFYLWQDPPPRSPGHTQEERSQLSSPEQSTSTSLTPTFQPVRSKRKNTELEQETLKKIIKSLDEPEDTKDSISTLANNLEASLRSIKDERQQMLAIHAVTASNADIVLKANLGMLKPPQ